MSSIGALAEVEFTAMNRNFLFALVILPGNVLLVIPAAILWSTEGTGYAAEWASFDRPPFWLAIALGAAALVLMAWTCRLFLGSGGGTPAPWAPPTRLVVRGPYRHVRNPMISGVLAFLLAEALILESWPIAAWAMLFFLANAIYFPFSEEPALEERFGDDYRRYKAHVRRWVPRLRPWDDS